MPLTTRQMDGMKEWRYYFISLASASSISCSL